MAEQFVHLGPQDLPHVAAGGFHCGDHHFRFFMGRLLQEAFLIGINQKSDDQAETQEDDTHAHQKFLLQTEGGQGLDPGRRWGRRLILGHKLGLLGPSG